MQIDRRITNGLAWAGAALVVAIPVADYVSGTLMQPAAPQVALVQEEAPVAPVPATRPASQVAKPAPEMAAEPKAEQKDEITTASATTQTRVSGSDAVDAYLQSGKAMPSYITGGGSPAAPAAKAAPAAATALAATTAPKASTASTAPSSNTAPARTQPQEEPVEVASLPPARIAPVPMPLSMRPKPVIATTNSEPPLIIDEPAQAVQTRPQQISPRTEPVVTADDLRNWESGPLTDFLARRQQNAQTPAESYDPDGFFLDQGPNNSSARFQRFPRSYNDDDVIYYVR